MLKEIYPNNLHYISNYIENSIRLEAFDELHPDIELLLASEKDYYQYIGKIFYGIFLGKNGGSLNEALEQLKIADKLGDQKEIRVPHYDSILFLEMGKIHKKLGNEDLAKNYFKKSVKSAEYIAYRKDAEEMLKN